VAVSDFYRLIVLKTKTHQHGGPVHAEVTSVGAEFVVETCQLNNRFNSDALMIEVDDLSQTLLKLQEIGITPHFTLSDGQSVYV